MGPGCVLAMVVGGRDILHWLTIIYLSSWAMAMPGMNESSLHGLFFFFSLQLFSLDARPYIQLWTLWYKMKQDRNFEVCKG